MSIRDIRGQNINMKTIKAVAPYIHPGSCNFKTAPYEAWIAEGGLTAKSHYPYRAFHGIIYKYGIPKLFEYKQECRLRFVSGYSIYFDTFPDYITYEIIPIIWDCWPKNVNDVAKYFKHYNIKTAIFTSSQTADIFRNIFPEMNILTITEGIDINIYEKGAELKERTIDVLEIGRKKANFFATPLNASINHIKTGNFDRTFKTDEEFRKALSDTKITITVPRCDVDKEVAGDIETLTQRYWECMLSRIVMVGRAPQELIDLIGYNPVIEWDGINATPLVENILNNIDEYQDLVDKNYQTAIKIASWNIRLKQIMNFLKNKEYDI